MHGRRHLDEAAPGLPVHSLGAVEGAAREPKDVGDLFRIRAYAARGVGPSAPANTAMLSPNRRACSVFTKRRSPARSEESNPTSSASSRRAV